MSDAISWELRLAVKAGKVEELRALVDDLVASTRQEPGAQVYEWFITDDETVAHLHERYSDSSAASEHLATFAERFADRLDACVDPMGFDVYGEPDQSTRDALAPSDPTWLRRWNGFARHW